MSDLSLLPPNATPLERAVDAASARIDGLDVPLADLWSPDRCPLAALPWLAWALGVETWQPDWPESLKRRACAEAFEVHAEKGTVAALQRVLALIGAVYDYTEGPAGGLQRMAAKVSILNSSAIELDGLDEVTAALGRVKRASLHLDVEILSGFGAQARLAAGFGTLSIVRFGSEGAPA